MGKKLKRPIEIERSVPACGCREAFCPHAGFGTDTADEQRALRRLVKLFSREMQTKLERKLSEGYSGWSESEWRSEMWEYLKEHVERGPSQALDVANLAMFVWNLDEAAAEKALEVEEE